MNTELQSTQTKTKELELPPSLSKCPKDISISSNSFSTYARGVRGARDLAVLARPLEPVAVRRTVAVQRHAGAHVRVLHVTVQQTLRRQRSDGGGGGRSDQLQMVLVVRRLHVQNVLGDDGVAVVGQTLARVRAGVVGARVLDDQLVARLLCAREEARLVRSMMRDPDI